MVLKEHSYTIQIKKIRFTYEAFLKLRQRKRGELREAYTAKHLHYHYHLYIHKLSHVIASKQVPTVTKWIPVLHWKAEILYSNCVEKNIDACENCGKCM